MSQTLHLDIDRAFPSGPRIKAHMRVDLTAAPVLVLFGPSGSGKTTVLRCIAGLDRPQQGRISLGEHHWLDTDSGASLPPQQRQIGYVSQDPSLFPHLTVRRNIAYGVHGHNSERSARVDWALDLTGLRPLQHRRPSQLSGGQKQRVAIARAIAPRPQLLLLDEPLASLDAAARDTVGQDLRALIIAAGIPAILVTHDRDEARLLGDALAVMVDGQVRQVGPLDEVFSRPADPAVASAVGVESILPGRILDTRDGLSTVAVHDIELIAVNDRNIHGDVLVCIRAVDVILGGDPHATSARNCLLGAVTAIRPRWPLVQVTLDCGFPLTSLVTHQAAAELGLRPGVPIAAAVKAPNVHLVRRGVA